MCQVKQRLALFWLNQVRPSTSFLVCMTQKEFDNFIGNFTGDPVTGKSGTLESVSLEPEPEGR